MNVIYEYDKDTRKASCIIEDKNIIGVGNAACHPTDEDIASERTGLCIAEDRAKIHFLQNKKEVKLKPALAALNHLYATMSHSKQFNEHSYEAKRIRKEIKNLQKEINQANCSIELIRARLRDYIDTKDKMARMYRVKNKIKENTEKNGTENV